MRIDDVIKSCKQSEIRSRKGKHVDLDMFYLCTLKIWIGHGFYNIVGKDNTRHGKYMQETRKFWAKIKRRVGRPWFAGECSIE